VCLVHQRALIAGTLRCPVCGRDCPRWTVRDAAGDTVAWSTSARATVTDELLVGLFSAAQAQAPPSRDEIRLAWWAQPSREWPHRRRA